MQSNYYCLIHYDHLEKIKSLRLIDENNEIVYFGDELLRSKFHSVNSAKELRDTLSGPNIHNNILIPIHKNIFEFILNSNFSDYLLFSDFLKKTQLEEHLI